MRIKLAELLPFDRNRGRDGGEQLVFVRDVSLVEFVKPEATAFVRLQRIDSFDDVFAGESRYLSVRERAFKSVAKSAEGKLDFARVSLSGGQDSKEHMIKCASHIVDRIADHQDDWAGDWRCLPDFEGADAFLGIVGKDHLERLQSEKIAHGFVEIVDVMVGPF